MATETAKVSTLDKVLNKIDAFFEGLMTAKKEGDDIDPDADDEPEAETVPAPAAKKAKKATDEEDAQDPDDDADPDKDDDVDMKKDAEIKRLNTLVSQQTALLKEAKTQLEQKNEDVRDEIKSTFKPTGSQRSTKIGIKGETPAWNQASTDLGKRAAQLTKVLK